MENLKKLKPGQVVYHVDYEKGCVTGKLFMASCLDHALICTKQFGMDFESQVCFMNGKEEDVTVIYKSNIFKTKEEAEKYL